MKVLIVDDHALIREALCAVLRQLKREAVIFEASSSRQAVDIVEEHPDTPWALLADRELKDPLGFRWVETYVPPPRRRDDSAAARKKQQDPKTTAAKPPQPPKL